ncbi:tyrosine-type recombinase/integrase [Corynebacterium variabile]|uniref:Site-specific integrase n=1 Tax=Corynebacterium variabile TaxID=1727 RepID=A0A4Y4C3G6_9CORY|nr:site-specific integrase [Corynebacterium variabile]GEC87571.1 site-specific integrase [Corynebacterium variabile]
MAPRREVGGVRVDDLWHRRDGEQSAAYGRGKRWRVRWVDPAGKERSRSYARKVDARRAADALTTDLTRGAYVDRKAGQTTVGEVYDLWHPLQVHLKPSSRARQGELWGKHLKPKWGTTPVAAVTRPSVQSWAVELLGDDDVPGVAPGTVRKIVGVLRQVMGHAVELGTVVANPVTGVRLPASGPSRNLYLTVGQVEWLADAVAVEGGDDRHPWTAYGVLVRLLAYTGLRWGEAVALRVEDVTLPSGDRVGRLQVHRTDVLVGGKRVEGTPKNHRSRSVPVPGPLVVPLRALMSGRRKTARVFTTPGGAPVDGSNFRARLWAEVLEEAGERMPAGLRVHDLRHTAASLAIASGASVKAVQRMLGHATATMTLDTYADLFPDDLDDVARRMTVMIERGR